MLRRLLQIPNQSKFFRQYIATLLLLFFAWDGVMDSVPPIHAVRDFSGGSVVSVYTLLNSVRNVTGVGRKGERLVLRRAGGGAVG